MQWRWLGCLGAALLTGCGGDDTESSLPDGGSHPDVSNTVPDGSISHSPFDLFDGLPIGEGVCGACVRRYCGGEIHACANDEVCRDGLQCVARTCLGADGGGEASCVVPCFGGDPFKAVVALDSFQCIVMTCDDVCPFEGGISEAGSDDGGPEPDSTVVPEGGETDAEPTADGGTPADATLEAATPDSGDQPQASPPDADSGAAE